MNIIILMSRIAGYTGASLMALTGAMLAYEVIARYFFIMPTTWAAELSQLCLIWGCLLAMPYVLATRHHITVNAVTNLLTPPVQRLCVAVALLWIIAFSVIVTLWGWEIFFDSFSRGRTTGSLLNMPVWISELAVPVGFALLTLQATAELITLRHTHLASLGSSHE